MGKHTGGSKEYYFGLFEKGNAIAKGIDQYLYKECTHKEEVEDYHE